MLALYFYLWTRLFSEATILIVFAAFGTWFNPWFLSGCAILVDVAPFSSF